MSLTPEEFHECVVAIPGDFLLCPECREPLLRFTTATFRGVAFLPAAKPTPSGDRYKLYCVCGGGAVREAARAPSNDVEDAQGPRILVRSGSWTGWRALGGE